MVAVHEQILSDAAGRLDAIVGYTFEREPDRVPEDRELPKLELFDGTINRVPVPLAGIDQFEMTLTVAITVGSATPSSDLAAALVAVTNAIFAAPTMLGDKVTRLELDQAPDRGVADAEGARSYSDREVVFLVEFWTLEGDLETIAP
jgi:hypothetical protein